MPPVDPPDVPPLLAPEEVLELDDELLELEELELVLPPKLDDPPVAPEDVELEEPPA